MAGVVPIVFTAAGLDVETERFFTVVPRGLGERGAWPDGYPAPPAVVTSADLAGVTTNCSAAGVGQLFDGAQPFDVLVLIVPLTPHGKNPPFVAFFGVR